MGDSEDDLDIKRRDKFRGERRPANTYGAYRRARQDSFSPEPRGRQEMSPPPKRARGGNWDEDAPRQYRRPPQDRGEAGGGVAMMSFKCFLSTQDDTIGEDEAIKKYGEYKLEFKRQQLNEFFVTHKGEEWFKEKYHPDESVRRRRELKEALEKRLEVFRELMEGGMLSKVSVDSDRQDELVKILDTVVIKLEGGTEEDLAVLEPRKEAIAGKKYEANGLEPIAGDLKEGEDASVQENENDIKHEDVENGEKECEDSEDASSPNKGNDDDEETVKANGGEDKEDESRESMEEESGEISSKENGEIAKVSTDEAKPDVPPRVLHKTTSIYLRTLPPSITKAEVVAMCKKFDGFLRAAIADPAPSQRWFRRGWITFDRDAKIKEICFSLNSIRLRDCDIGPAVNRDLARRIRPITGITIDRKIVRNDIKLAVKIIANLDGRWGLWTKSPAVEGDTFGLNSNNPLLANVTDYLIEEASAEEEELLGKREEGETGGGMAETVVRDDELLAVLDKLILYLRIVHSIDYYNHSEYPYEDEMPNRCGMLHARGSPPDGPVDPEEIQNYSTDFEKKMGGFLVNKQDLGDDDITKLGAKVEQDELDKFVAANTQEIGKDKWICPLSGKKFKGPEFIKKHIENKHGEKLEEVKKEVQFFNNYLKDPKRPQNPEAPPAKAPRPDHRGGGRHQDPYFYSGAPRDATNYPVFRERRGRGDYERGYRRPPQERLGGGFARGPRVTHAEQDPRSIVDYSDVDNVDNGDYF